MNDDGIDTVAQIDSMDKEDTINSVTQDKSSEESSITEKFRDSIDVDSNVPNETPPLSFKIHVQMMKLALKDAQNWCYGVKAIEVWLYNDEGKLERAEGGLYVDPVYFHNNDPHISAALRSLYDINSSKYAELDDSAYAPGEGLPGVLWSDTSGIALSSQSESINQGGKIHWRDVLALANDPDQPYNLRIKVMACAGFRRAAGIRFKVRGAGGIVVFMTRESAVINELNHELNEEYMIMVTEHIGSLLNLMSTRQILSSKRSVRVNKAFAKVRRNLRIFLAFMGDLSQMTQSPKDLSWREKMIKFGIGWANKMRGANIQPPPGLSSSMTIFVFFAAFITTFTMLYISSVFRRSFGKDFGFIHTQIASTLVSVYTLTASPAAQPRSIILGRIISMLVGMTFSYIPDNNPTIGAFRDSKDSPLEWVRLCCSISFSTAIMAKLGLAFPPGGALSIIFLTYKWDIVSFKKFGVIVLQDSIFVILVSFINNLTASRSYPTYWGFLPNMASSQIRGLFKKKFEGKEGMID